MASKPRASSAMGSRTAAAGAAKRSYFEQQREILIGEIAMSFEHALANINKLNRSLEAVITVGNEFSSVEALWSQFEGVMAKEEDATDNAGVGAGAGAHASADNGEDDGRDDEGHAGSEGQEEDATDAEWKDQISHKSSRR